jgi:hypothetical protein
MESFILILFVSCAVHTHLSSSKQYDCSYYMKGYPENFIPKERITNNVDTMG